MMAVSGEADESLLRAPSSEKWPTLQRLPSTYASLQTYALPKDKHYQQQYGDMYFLRLSLLKPSVEAVAEAAWTDFSIGGTVVRKVDRVLDVRQGELCWVAGTIYMEMALKPNILDDISKDIDVTAPPPPGKFFSAGDNDRIMLEDESGRLRLVGPMVIQEGLVTGVIVAVMGTENANGEFDVVDVRVSDLGTQPERWSLSSPPDAVNGSSETKSKSAAKKRKHEDDEDEEMTDISDARPGNGSKIALVSGLDISGVSSSNSLQIDLLMEYLLGESLTPSSQDSVSRISRLIIAGNSISSDASVIPEQASNLQKHKKYGYDSSAYNPTPMKHFDDFLATLLPSMPVTLIPGAQDPANTSLPQQPVHGAMFPRSRNYGVLPKDAGGKEGETGWFDAVTNPWEGEVEGWRFLGTGGQNVDDVFRYVEGEDRLGMMENMCRWRVVAPTAPDTLWSYPFQDDDPFVMKHCPHVFFVGNQPEFATTMIDGPEGQMVRLISIPRFSETGEIVLLDSETLGVSRVKIDVFEDLGKEDE